MIALGGVLVFGILDGVLIAIVISVGTLAYQTSTGRWRSSGATRGRGVTARSLGTRMPSRSAAP